MNAGDAISAQRVATLLQARGYLGNIEIDNHYVIVRSGAEGIKFTICLYPAGIDKSAPAESIQLTTSWPVEEGKVDAVSAKCTFWNRARRYSKAYAVSGGVHLEWDILCPEGASDIVFARWFDEWLKLMPAFLVFIRPDL
jgi:hypothetical protein